jgi:hypothetical protein
MAQRNGTPTTDEAVRRVRSPDYERLRQLIDRLEHLVARMEELEIEDEEGDDGGS